RTCQEPIAFRYPMVELISGLLAVFFFYVYGFSPAFFVYFYFVCSLVVIAMIDLELMVIPVASLVYPAAFLGLIFAAFEPSMALTGPWLWAMVVPAFGPHLASLLGALGGFILGWGTLALVSAGYKAVRGVEGMGDGDPPLLGMIGVFLGWRAIPLVILWSTLIGLFSVVVLMFLARGKAPDEGWGQKALPFGPFLVLASFLYLFFGPAFLAWYASLIYS
ncbi:MAG: prepilin peptidase, partial [Candidatus Adiutrix sp.]